MNTENNIAVFGDTHGHLRLMFHLCQLWQTHHQRHLDGILQCGDLGFFPDISALDKATRTYAKKDTEELGFAHYFRQPQPLFEDKMLKTMFEGPQDSFESINTPVLWCNGNHEDFQELYRLVGSKDITPVDAYGMLHYIRSGVVTSYAGLSIAAIGGAPERRDDSNANQKVPAKWKYVDIDSCSQLTGSSFDVLISHGAPEGLGGESDTGGSALLRLVR